MATTAMADAGSAPPAVSFFDLQQTFKRLDLFPKLLRLALRVSDDWNGSLKRREFITLVGGAAAWPIAASAQQRLLPLVGILWTSTPQPSRLAAVLSGLAEGGFVQGKDYTVALRSAEGDLARLATLAAELAALKPHVIVAVAYAATVAHKVAPNVPLVFGNFAADPIKIGLIENYARPGGTATGNVYNAFGGEEAITAKRITLFKELAPAVKRLGFIGTPETPLFGEELSGIKAVATSIGFEFVALPARTIDDMVVALKSDVDAFCISGGPVTSAYMVDVAALAARTGKPTVGVYPDWAHAGLLMSYGANPVDSARGMGVYAAKILAGAKPADLPVEQASKFSFVINLKSAKALGIAVPATLLSLADEVIE